MPKEISKIMFGGLKWRHMPPRFDLAFGFGAFGVMQKNDGFWTPPAGPKTQLGHSQIRLKNYAKEDLENHVLSFKMTTYASQIRFSL